MASSALHLHHLIHRHHVVVQVRHDPERTREQQENNQHAEGERHDIVDVVRACRDVEEEDEVYAHLRDGDARRLTARARERSSTLIPLLPGKAWSDGAEVRLAVADSHWEGPGSGEGRLTSRRLAVTMGGRGSAARPRRILLWLPAPDGGVAVALPDGFAGADIDRLPDDAVTGSLLTAG